MTSSAQETAAVQSAPAVPDWLDRNTPITLYGAMLGVGSVIAGEIDAATPRSGETRRAEIEHFLHRTPDANRAEGLVRQWLAEVPKKQGKSLKALVAEFDALSGLPEVVSVTRRS
ncbi:hypothetical protein [Saccharothrix sp.]|uniref:hypothetical protein n=1 Tax=Saccharothrix sp. TaxID=1873460 RepID=UPI002811AB9E|nr:hypothetical protein [Saccharothrix sp.]